MIDYLQRNIFTVIFAGLIIVIALWLPDVWSPDANYPHTVTQPLQSWMLSQQWMSGMSGLLVGLALTVVAAILLFISNAKHLFVSANDRLLPLLYLALSSALPETLYYPEAQAAAIAVIMGLYCLFQSYPQKTALTQLFLSAMWISIAALSYFPAVTVLLAVFISMLSTRPFNWRDWAAFLAGCLCPYFYFGLYLLLMEDSIAPLWHSVQANFHSLSLPVIAHNLYEYVFVIILMVIIVWVCLLRKNKGALNKIRAIQLRNANRWLLICILIAVVIFQPPYGSIMPLLSIPLSIIIANADKRLWSNKIYIFLLLLLTTAIIGTRIM